MYAPDTDGIDHINIYSKGKTELGRLLTNFALSPFNFEPYGSFASVEAFWYYYLTGCKHEKIRALHGYNAKKYGKSLHGYRSASNEDRVVILEAIRCKMRKNKRLLQLLKESSLPLTHYYAYGSKGNWKVYNQDKYHWITDEIERIRNILKINK